MIVDWSAASAFLSIVIFLAVRWWRLGKGFKRGEAAKIAILGAGFPAAVLVCLTPFNPELLQQVTDKPAYLLPMAMIMVMYSIGYLFDWDT